MDNKKIGVGEQFGGAAVPNPEVWQLNQAGEQFSKTPEKSNEILQEPIASEGLNSLPMPAMEEMASVGRTVDEANPEIALDKDNIEREWVKRTEDVITKTKGDPRQKEIELNELKADYMFKRFGRRLGDRNANLTNESVEIGQQR